MIESIITSKTRIKILLKFFLNNKTQSYLRSLESEFKESSNAIRVELNRLEEAGLLISNMWGNKKIYRANTIHPLYNDINNIIRKTVGVDQIIEKIIVKIGNLEAAYIIGEFAIGKDSEIIDLILIGQNLNEVFINNYVRRLEKQISRKIRYIVLSQKEFEEFYSRKPSLLIWNG